MGRHFQVGVFWSRACALCLDLCTDSQTLKEAGIYGNLFKVILGSKSFNPMGRPEDAPPVKLINSYCCSVQSRMEYNFDDDFTPEQTRILCSIMWHVSGCN